MTEPAGTLGRTIGKGSMNRPDRYVHVASACEMKTRVYAWRSQLLDFIFGVVDAERRCTVNAGVGGSNVLMASCRSGRR